MKETFGTWGWSAGMLLRSPLFLAELVILAASWGLAGYQWLWIPESSALMLLVSVLWAGALILAAIAVLAGATWRAGQAAAGADRVLALGLLPRGRQFAQTLWMLVIGLLLALFLAGVFGWVNGHALEVASFLTFHLQKPVSYIVLQKVYYVVEALIGIAVTGFLASLLIFLLQQDWRQTRGHRARILASCCFKSSMLTGILSLAVFGGLAYLLATWHPKVTPGFWDYAQMIVRLGLALVLLVAGALFWLLSLARLNLPSEKISS